MKLLLLAVGVACVFEGVPYFLAPDGVRTWADFVRTAQEKTLRIVGASLMAGGLLLIATVRRWYM
jgi:uncharacterized protein YjeT (DUF2065 family)